MSVLDIDAFAAALPPQGALLGLDPGAKRVGVAASDSDRRVASPVAVLPRGRFATLAAAIFALGEERGFAGIIIGLPLNMDGGAGPAAQAARAFARNLAALRPELPLAMWDERLSTSAVTRALIADDASRAQRAALVDKLAAAYMLQGALERLARLDAG